MLSRAIWIWIGIAVLLLLLINSPHAPRAEGQLYVVEIHDFYFDPPGLFLQPGDRVTWILLEDRLGNGHSATTYHPAHDRVLRIPEASEPWSTGLLPQIGDTYERTFDISGVYDYFCMPHEDRGMVGRIVVKEAIGPGTKPLEQGVSLAGQSAMPTLEELLGQTGEIFDLQARINAVVLSARKQDRQAALEVLDELTEGLQAQDYRMLGKTAQWEDVLAGFGDLSEAIVLAKDLNEITEIAEDLKALLDEVSQQPPKE